MGSNSFKYGLSNITNPTWLTFIHELGHNFGMDHSFDLGEGTTGGFMDYGDGTYNGVYGWNPQYTLDEFETEINSANVLPCSSIGNPIADFESIELICIGNTIEFKNRSLGGAISYNWTFPGGTPSNSTEINPLVTYSTIGLKSVSLTATNINGFNSVTKNIIVSATPNIADCIPTASYDPQNNNDGGSTYFQLNTINKTSGGSRSDEGYYHDYTCTDNTILELDTDYNVNISQVYQSNETSHNVLFIDYNSDGDFNDVNEIAYSGTDLSFTISTPISAVVENEILRARLSVQIFSNSNDPCYQPNQNLAQVEDYGVYFLNLNNLSNTKKSELNFQVYPNPTDRGFVTIRTSNNDIKKIEVFDISGKKLINTFLQSEQLDISSLSSSIYLLKVSIRGASKIIKLVVK